MNFKFFLVGLIISILLSILLFTSISCAKYSRSPLLEDPKLSLQCKLALDLCFFYQATDKSICAIAYEKCIKKMIWDDCYEFEKQNGIIDKNSKIGYYPGQCWDKLN